MEQCFPSQNAPKWIVNVRMYSAHGNRPPLSWRLSFDQIRRLCSVYSLANPCLIRNKQCSAQSCSHLKRGNLAISLKPALQSFLIVLSFSPGAAGLSPLILLQQQFIKSQGSIKRFRVNVDIQSASCDQGNNQICRVDSRLVCFCTLLFANQWSVNTFSLMLLATRGK